MAERRFREKFNSAIVFAPTFSRKREHINPYSLYMRKISRPNYVQEMLEATSIDALAVTYIGDPFNRPADLMFLIDSIPVKYDL